MKSIYKILGVVVLILIVSGLYVGHKDLWWFSPAYSERQTSQSFFGDLSKANDSAAYKLTSPTFQDSNIYTSFQSKFTNLSGNKLNIKYISYKKVGSQVVIVATINDVTSGSNLSIAGSFQNSKIDTMSILSNTNQ